MGQISCQAKCTKEGKDINYPIFVKGMIDSVSVFPCVSKDKPPESVSECARTEKGSQGADAPCSVCFP